nr:heterogeneous nuclear ribonucleoprotein A1, A2/B1 homolog [Arachis hypogaea]
MVAVASGTAEEVGGGGGCCSGAGTSGRVMGVGGKGWVADGDIAMTAARWGGDRGGGQWRWWEEGEGRRRKKRKEEGSGVATGSGWSAGWRRSRGRVNDADAWRVFLQLDAIA